MFSLKNLTILLICCILMIGCNTDSVKPDPVYKYDPVIRVNQIGYNLSGVKTAIVTNTKEINFDVVDSEDNIVYSGELSSEVKCNISGDYVRIADFSSLIKPGNYKLKINEIGYSYSFEISNTLYSDVFDSVLKSYYFQRCSFELEEKYAGKWARTAGHPDNNLILHESTGKSGVISSPGGWYDAGDYGKYMVNSGITVWTLLALYELYPDLVRDDLNIPESGNGKSDLLDEVKYQLDWMLTMQDEDGGVFFKVGPIEWPWTVMPEDDNYNQRYVLGKSTTSTLNFAAVLAQASRVYKDYDSLFAGKCLEASKKAWDWALANDNVSHPDITIPGTGPYDDSNYEDEFLLAAAELLKATGNNIYKNYIESNIGEVIVYGKAWWQDLRTLSYFSLIRSENLISENLKSDIKSKVISYADKLINIFNNSTFKVPLVVDDFSWGSYGNLANYLVILVYAYEETGDDKYKDVVNQSADFFFGKNPTGYTAITGAGDNPPMNPHHRPSGADYVYEPVPGLVVGGSNQKQEDKIVDGKLNVDYIYNEPGKSYMDVYDSWSSNENAINQNAPVVFVLGFIHKYMDNL